MSEAIEDIWARSFRLRGQLYVTDAAGVPLLTMDGTSRRVRFVDASGNVIFDSAQDARPLHHASGTLVLDAKLHHGRLITNLGAVGSTTITLPNDPPEGFYCSFMTLAAQAQTIQASSGETLYFNGGLVTSISYNAIGGTLTVYAGKGGAGGIFVGGGAGYSGS